MKSIFLVIALVSLTGCPKKPEVGECERYDNGNCKAAIVQPEEGIAPGPPEEGKADQ